MTDEARAALRDDIENLTIRQARERGDVARETLRVLEELGLAEHRAMLTPAVTRVTTATAPATPAALTMCPCCGRECDGKAVGFAACPLGVECPAMAHKQTNKQTLVHSLSGPGTAVVGDRATLLAQPAFDANGEPT